MGRLKKFNRRGRGDKAVLLGVEFLKCLEWSKNIERLQVNSNHSLLLHHFRPQLFGVL